MSYFQLRLRRRGAGLPLAPSADEPRADDPQRPGYAGLPRIPTRSEDVHEDRPRRHAVRQHRRYWLRSLGKYLYGQLRSLSVNLKEAITLSLSLSLVFLRSKF